MNMNNPMSNIPPLGPPTGMPSSGAPSKFKPIDPLRVLRGNWLWIVFALIIGGGLGAGTWYGLNKLMPEYTSEAQFRVDLNNDRVNGRGNAAVRMTELEPLILSEVQDIMSEPILRTVLNKPQVQQTPWFSQFNNNIDDALEDLEDHVLSAAHIRDTQLFIARATTPEEDDAQIILNALSDEYMRLNDIQVSRESDRDLEAARRRLNATEESITGINGAITRFLTSTPLESLDDRTSEAAIQVGQLVVKKNELLERYNSLEATYQQLLDRESEGQFDPSDEERQFIEQNQEIMRLDEQLRALRIQRKTELRKYGEKHDVILALDERTLATEQEHAIEFDKQARELFNAKLEQAALGQAILNQELAKVDESLKTWTVRRQEYVQRRQEYDTLKRELEGAEEQRKLAQQSIQDLLELSAREARVLVQESYPPQKAKKSFPPEAHITIPGVTLLVTALVTGLIFLRELMDQRVRSAADVKMVPDASLVGMIPAANEDRGTGGTIEHVVEQQPSGLLAEAFRQVRTAVLSKMDRRGYKTLMLLSAKPGAGVTAIAQNLGASCALSGRRVLIIDANFRRPGQASLMNLGQTPGLSDLLCGDHDIEEALSMVQQSQTQNLSLLPAGDTEKAAAELFENPRFRELLGKLEAEYDLLIIDAPPALLTSDAQLLSRHVDAMLLVSRAQSDTRGMLQRMYRELDGQRSDILGIVLNGVQAAAGGYLKRNFKEFHDYSGPERRQGKRAAAPAMQRAAQPAAVPASAESNGIQADDPSDETTLIDSEELVQDDEMLGGFDLGEDEENKP